MGGMTPDSGPVSADDDAGASQTEADVSKLAIEQVLAELDTAHEELRVADEEVRTQREEIERLLGERGDGLAPERLIANLPVAMLVTDNDGSIRTANTAACALFGVAQEHLHRKPLAVFINPTDRSQVRQAVSEVVRERSAQSLMCAVQPRGGVDQRVQLVVSPRSGGAQAKKSRLLWIALTDRQMSSAAPQQGALAEGLTRLVTLTEQSEDGRFFTEVAQICQEIIAPAAAVSVVVGAPAHPTAVASDSKLAQTMDGLQVHANEGPCQQAWERGEVVVTHRLDEDSRWPELVRMAAPEKVASVLAVPVSLADETVGVVNAYATEPDLFADLDIHTTELLAAAVAAVIYQVRERERLTRLNAQLEEALTSRAAIDQAKGILMARYGYDPDQAFQHLVRVSRSRNIKLRDLARLLVKRTQRQTPPSKPPGQGPSTA
jgi:PAS domain S-box-containing protein